MNSEAQSFQSEKQQGPSWARDNWPLADLDALNSAMDPTDMAVAVKNAVRADAGPRDVGQQPVDE